MENVHLYLVSTVLIFSIIIASAGIYWTVPASNPFRDPTTMIPENSTSIAMITTPIGKIFTFSVNSSPGIIIPASLPNLILDRGMVLQKVNVSEVILSDFGYIQGIAIYRVSGINLSNILVSTSGIGEILGLLNLNGLNSSEIFISDTLSGSVVLGGLNAVTASVCSYFSQTENTHYLDVINLTANDSVHLFLRPGSGLSYINLNSTGNTTNVSLTFSSRTALYEFQLEYLYLLSSDKVKSMNLSYSGDNVTQT